MKKNKKKKEYKEYLKYKNTSIEKDLCFVNSALA